MRKDKFLDKRKTPLMPLIGLIIDLATTCGYTPTQLALEQDKCMYTLLWMKYTLQLMVKIGLHFGHVNLHKIQ